MSNEKKPSKIDRSAKTFLSIRVDDEQKKLIEQAADREGLQISSLIIMVLVRVHILPESCLKKIKRRPAPNFNELHALLGTINLIGGNFKQLYAALPELPGVREAHACMMRASDTVSEALHGKPLPASAAPTKLDHRLTAIGYSFNDIVRSVNMGKPQLGDLPEVLDALKRTADLITAMISGRPINDLAPFSASVAATIKTDMKSAAAKNTKPPKGRK